MTGSDGYALPRDANNNGFPDHLDANDKNTCESDADGDGIEDVH